ncbi:hypothetical protein D0856_05350 [Vibrio owensii]|uniref:hypothetical protein n=1 Tax=Vibrio owensii TaxID=696485 RepID=UPI000EFBEADE|nr:hypothetical protein [Vibrio owensii]AYO19597.1 hypothetical protein D0856_05350 [Vibrio owensii]
MSAEEIMNLAKKKQYEKAYFVGKRYLEKSPNNVEVVEALKVVSSDLRSRCMDLAYKNADHTSAYFKVAGLLEKVNQLTNQDLYGNVIIPG